MHKERKREKKVSDGFYGNAEEIAFTGQCVKIELLVCHQLCFI